MSSTWQRAEVLNTQRVGWILRQQILRHDADRQERRCTADDTGNTVFQL